MFQGLKQTDSNAKSHNSMDRATVSEIEAAVSDSVEVLCGRLSNILTCRKPELLGEPEEYRDAHIAALRIALDRVTRSLSLTITAKKFHKDQTPRIHLLPSDVLIPLLRGGLPVVTTENRWQRDKAGSAIRDYFVRLHLLRRVCRDWRNVIDGNFSFWTYISPECPEVVVDEAFRKSSSAPLFIADSPADEESYVAFLNRVSSHAHRWETIVFRHIPSMSIARSILCEPTPALRKAFIKVVPGTEGAQTPINLFYGHTKSLRALSMYSLPRGMGLAVLYGPPVLRSRQRSRGWNHLRDNSSRSAAAGSNNAVPGGLDDLRPCPR